MNIVKLIYTLISKTSLSLRTNFNIYVVSLIWFLIYCRYNQRVHQLLLLMCILWLMCYMLSYLCFISSGDNLSF